MVKVEFDKDFLRIIENIQDAITAKKLVIFVGAGVSRNSDIPTWGDLITKIKSKMDIDEDDYLIVPQYFYNMVGKVEYHQVIEEFLRHNKTEPNDIHEQIIDLNPEHIITTNYDNLLDKLAVANSYSIICEDKDLSYSKTNRFFIKMHGDFDRKNIVLKEDDYLRYQDNFPLIESFLKGLFSSNTILFIGFSFDDINLKYIIERVRNILQKNYRPVILFTGEKKENISVSKIDYFKNRGVTLLPYHNSVVEYLKPFMPNSISLSNPGLKLYCLLKFTKLYKRVDFGFKDLHILEQMYLSLMQFDTLQSIPPTIIAKLAPFAIFNSESKVYQSAKYYSENFRLRTYNDRIIIFLKQCKELNILESDNSGFSVVINKENLEKHLEVDRAYEKLQFVTLKLKNSSINSIDGILNRTNHLTNVENPLGQVCECHRCMFNRLELSTILFELSRGKHNTDGLEENCDFNLSTAYTAFLLGDFMKSYYILKGISSSSYKRGEYVKYFISNYNISKLLFPINDLIVDHEIDVEQKGKILEEIRNIDLIELISEIPIGDHLKETLLFIIKQDMVFKTQSIFNNYFPNVINLYKVDSKETFYFRENPYNELIRNFAKLYNFLKHNLLFDVNFPPFIDLAYNIWDATLYAHKARRPNHGLQKVTGYLFEIAILYFSPIKFKKILKNHEFPQLDSPNKGVKFILDLAINFFSSAIKSDDAFINGNNDFETLQLQSRWFTQRIKNIGGNLLIAISLVSFRNNESRLNDFILLLIKHLKQIKFGLAVSDEYLYLIFPKIAQFASEEHLTLFTRTILESNIWCKDKILFQLSESIKEYKTDWCFQDGEVNELFLDRLKNGKNRDLDYLMPFATTLDVNSKKIAIEFLKNYFLDKPSDFENFFIAVDSKLLNHSEMSILKTYIIERLNMISDPINFITEAHIQDRGLDTVIYEFYNNENFKYKSEINDVLSSEVTSDFVKWVFAPKKFDYRKFKVEWLTATANQEETLDKIMEIAGNKIKGILSKFLKENIGSELSKLYFKYF